MAGEPGQLTEDEARHRIKRLQSLDTKAQDIDHIKKKVDTSGLKNEGIVVKKGTNIYRGRILDNRPGRVSELSYPPQEFAGLNRANRQNDPIFYGSSGAGATVFELEPEIGENIAILKWRVDEDLLLNTIGYSPKVLEQLDSSRNETEIPGHSLSESDGNTVLREYFARLFTQRVSDEEKHHHKLTAALAENWLSGDSIDGIMYPTVKTWGNYDNLAIQRESVDQKLEPISAEFIEIQQRQKREIEKETLDTSKRVTDGNIEWNGHGHQWVIETDGASAEFEFQNGRWKLSDSEMAEATPQHDPEFEY